jgi:Tfp pilus assembly major pilin PilA
LDFLQDKKNGFSGIELAIVIAVLSIFSAVAIPAFNCVRRRAISTAAQETIKQIKEECETNYIYGIDKFTSANPDKYQISASGSNSCSGGTVTLTPDDTNLYPTYLYKFADSEISYNFKGQTGTSFVACNKLICGDGVTKKINLNYDFVVENTFIERGCSAYVVVLGPRWEDAESNAKKIGGNLVSINNTDENKWLAAEFSKEKYFYDGDSNTGDPETWTHFWLGGKYINGNWNWTSQSEWFEDIKDNEPGIGTGKGTDSQNSNYPIDLNTRNKLLGHWNIDINENQHLRHGEGKGTYYWAATNGVGNNIRGIAEIPVCN